MTRRHLLDAAAVVFARDGFHGASLDDVAATAGFTKGAVYSNFKSKEDLFLAVFDDHFARERDEMQHVLGEPIERTTSDDRAVAAGAQRDRAQLGRRVDRALPGVRALRAAQPGAAREARGDAPGVSTRRRSACSSGVRGHRCARRTIRSPVLATVSIALFEGLASGPARRSGRRTRRRRSPTRSRSSTTRSVSTPPPRRRRVTRATRRVGSLRPRFSQRIEPTRTQRVAHAVGEARQRRGRRAWRRGPRGSGPSGAAR